MKSLLLITALLFSLYIDVTPTYAAKQTAPTNPTINEGAGLLISDVDGALPRGLWRNQSRLEITGLLKNMPTIAPLSSLQKIKRNMLISTYDTSDIKEDIKLPVGDDLLTIRLLKLLEMGLWNDAFNLYSSTIKDPGNNDALAQIGLLLILKEKGLATACLDEKAFGARFETSFWSQFALICTLELYDESADIAFIESDVLQRIYTQNDYTVLANEIEFLNSLSLLELAMLNYKDRITYDDFTVKDKMPPHLVKLFIDDEQISADVKTNLEPLARFYQLDGFRDNPNNDENTAQNIQIDTQNQLKDGIARNIITKKEIPINAVEKLMQTAPENKQNFFYLQLLSKLGLLNQTTPLPTPATDSYLQSFPPFYEKELEILKTWLDNQGEFSNNPVKVYEKQVSLTSEGDYITPSGDWTTWLGKAASHQFAGISLLIVLSNNNNVGARSANILNDLDNVGLIEQTHLLASDLTARLMREF